MHPPHDMTGAAVVLASSGGTDSVPEQRPATVVKPLSCEKLPNAPGKSMTTVLVQFPPMAYSPPHRHPGSVTAFVVKGTLRSQLAGGPALSYGAGQTWFEPPQILHVFAENPSPSESASCSPCSSPTKSADLL
jgi:quercetin dioxygenase-like cupin family protein